jgi:ACS family hexuronate transporter-like MFS transporter
LLTAIGVQVKIRGIARDKNSYQRHMRIKKSFRWWIAGVLALATALNYLDRQTFPVVVGEIKKEIPLSDGQYGQLTFLFLLAYAIMYAGGGRLMDRLGTRAGYALMIAWWSAANCLMGTVSSVFGLGVFRFLLGMGEGGGFPGSAKAVAEWFPPRERAMAFGIFNTGSAVGAVIAPPLIALIVAALGWRWVLYITGGAGFLWAWLWLMVYQPPAASRFVSAEERDMIQSAHAAVRAECAAAPLPSWTSLFRIGEVRGLMLAKFLSDAAWFFFIFWLPKYLGDVRNLNIMHIGYFAWIPYAFAGAGSMAAGILCSFLLRRQFSVDQARKITLAIGAALLPLSLLIVAAPLNFAIIFFSAVMFGHQCFSAIVQTLPADLFPSEVVGSVGGLLGSAGSFGAMFFNLLAGWMIEDYGYGPAFILAGLLHPLALLIILVSVKRIAPLTLAGVCPTPASSRTYL